MKTHWWLLVSIVFLLAIHISYYLGAHTVGKKSLPQPTLSTNAIEISNEEFSSTELLIETSSLAELLIKKSFNETYAILDQCSFNKDFRTCLQSTYNSLKKGDDDRHPWWFRTILRDAHAGRGLHGGWHWHEFASPLMRMCTIEKIGITQWKKVNCLLNGIDASNDCDKDPNLVLPPNAPKIVFLRDPLERFLSAYLDKCVGFYKVEKHCEPLTVFHNDENGLTEGLEENKRAKFEAYVDAMPLTWNVHFFPMGLYCGGIYRDIRSYSFVGKMDQNFYHTLNALGQQYGGDMTAALENVFSVSEKIKSSTNNTGKETRAAEHVKEYYSGKTVRRVLQYLSIDYVKLNLTVPEWAHKMLENEASGTER